MNKKDVYVVWLGALGIMLLGISLQFNQLPLGGIPKEFTSDFLRILQYNPVIKKVITKYCPINPPEYLIQGVIWQESRGMWYMINPFSSASGIGQFIPGSAHKYELHPTVDNFRKNYQTLAHAKRVVEELLQCRKEYNTYSGVYSCMIKKDGRFNPFRTIVATVKHICGDYEKLKGPNPGPHDRHWRLALQSYYQGTRTVSKKGFGRAIKRALILKFPIRKLSSRSVLWLLGRNKIDYFARCFNRARRFERLMSKRDRSKKPLSDSAALKFFDRHQKKEVSRRNRQWG